ncbi:hypothetical protein CROQUDRAFT_130856 [Cronartium quercuum f. sp. fusiforme G11]|uniref:MICOS complex subunit MIC60 n=1 Tax=Cronartium quercuum f. sp. fusiforme G11 TaxID=708437 RepID=A0A9P6TEZ0_9BASI|nr:hypothetical protein CROQUDRAFT_130856 [Cronartium quercuum f. sp. fusiforme G11]
MYATDLNAASKPKRKGLFRRFVLPTAFFGGVFYGAGIYASFQNEWVHDVFTETVPLAEDLVEYFEEYNLEKIGDVSKRAVEVTGGVITSAKNTLGFNDSTPQSLHVDQPTTEMKRDNSEESKSKAEANIEKMKAKTEAAVQRAQEIAAASENQVTKTAQKLDSAASTKANEALQALQANLPSSTTLSASTPKSASPSSPESLLVYPGSIPIGHEPPPGYTGAVPRPRDPSTTAAPLPPSLPLLAPSVREFSSSEPILGELASTIDNLAGFLRDNPEVAVRGKTDSGDDPPKVLANAEMELKHLGHRLEKIKTEERAYLERSLESQAKGYSKLLLDAERDLHQRLDKQEDDWKEAFESERQKLVKFYKTKLEKELESQQALIEERLKQEVISKGLEMQRKWMRQIKSQVEQEREGRLSRLVELESCIKELGRATLDHELYLDQNVRVHKLWNGLRALSRVFEFSFKRPFIEEVHALKAINKPIELSNDSDADLISTALSSLPAQTVASGVETLPSLTIWFKESVAPRVQSVTFFPDQGGFISYLVSYFLSNFLFEKRASGYEVQGNDVMAVLTRVEGLLNGRDLDGATRELNALKGWPKVLARDWLEAARRHLEVKQAVELIETEARLQSLLL